MDFDFDKWDEEIGTDEEFDFDSWDAEIEPTAKKSRVTPAQSELLQDAREWDNTGLEDAEFTEKVGKAARNVGASAAQGVGDLVRAEIAHESQRDPKTTVKAIGSIMEDLDLMSDEEILPAELYGASKKKKEAYFTKEHESFLKDAQKFVDDLPKPGPTAFKSGVGKVVEQGATGVARFGPAMAANVIPGLGMAASTGMTFTMLYGSKHEEVMEKTGDMEIANATAALHTVLSTPVEQLGNVLQIKALKGIFGKSANKIIDKGKALLKGAVGEGGEEGVQAITEAYADLITEMPGASISERNEKFLELLGDKKFWGNVGEQTKVGAVGGMLLPGVGVAVKAPFDVGKWLHTKATTADKQRTELNANPLLNKDDFKNGQYRVTPDQAEGSKDFSAFAETTDEKGKSPDVTTSKGVGAGISRGQVATARKTKRTASQRRAIEKEVRKNNEAARKNNELLNVLVSQKQAKRDAEMRQATLEHKKAVERNQFIRQLENPVQTMSIASDQMAAEHEAGNAKELVPMRKAHEALATEDENLNKLKTIQYQLGESMKAHGNLDWKTKQVAVSVKGLLDKRVTQLAQAEQMEQLRAETEKAEADKAKQKKEEGEAKVQARLARENRPKVTASKSKPTATTEGDMARAFEKAQAKKLVDQAKASKARKEATEKRNKQAELKAKLAAEREAKKAKTKKLLDRTEAKRRKVTKKLFPAQYSTQKAAGRYRNQSSVQDVQSKVDQAYQGIKVDALGEEGTSLPVDYAQVTVHDKQSPAFKATFAIKIGTPADMKADIQKKIDGFVDQGKAAKAVAEKPKAAAIKLPSGKIVEGLNHGDIVGTMEEADLDEVIAANFKVEEGFTDQDGNFLTREEAKERYGASSSDKVGLYRDKRESSKKGKLWKKAVTTHVAAASAQLKKINKIEVVETFRELPNDARQQILRDNATGLQGYFDPGTSTTYIVAENNPNSLEVKRSIWHELGHFSLRDLLGPDVNSFLDELAAKWNLGTGEQGRIEAEEMLIDKFQSGQKVPGMTKLMDLLRAFARKLGFGPNEITDADIRALLKSMKRNVIEGDAKVPAGIKNLVATNGAQVPLSAIGRYKLDDLKWDAPQNKEMFGTVNNRLSKELEVMEALFGESPYAAQMPGKLVEGKRINTRTIRAHDLGKWFYELKDSGELGKLLNGRVTPAQLVKERKLKGAAAKKFLKHLKTLRSNNPILSSNGKAGKSIDFALSTCQPTTPCKECYAAASMIRMSAVEKAIRNTALVINNPEDFAERIAKEISTQDKVKVPFLRLLGSGDLTSSEQVTSFNHLAKLMSKDPKAARPIQIFSRHHDNLRKLKGQPGVPFIKMGSVDAQLFKHYGFKYLKDNMGKHGIANAFLYTEESEQPAIKKLQKADALGLVLSADVKLHDKLPGNTQQASCPCDADERSYMASCRQCALSQNGCFMGFAAKGFDKKGKIWDIADPKAPADVQPFTLFLEGVEQKGDVNPIAQSYSKVAQDIIQKSIELVQLYIREFKNGNKNEIPLKDIRAPGDVIKVTDVKAAETYRDNLRHIKSEAANGTFELPGGEIQPGVKYEDFKKVEVEKGRYRKIKDLNGKTIDAPRTFYRGQVKGGTKRIKTSDSWWDRQLFVSSNRSSAEAYGDQITEYDASDASILYEGTKEFRSIGKGVTTNQSGLVWASTIARRAEEAGYDAVWFKRQGDIGTIVFNKDKFVTKEKARYRYDPDEYIGPKAGTKKMNLLKMSWADKAATQIFDSLKPLELLEQGKDIDAAMSGYKSMNMISNFPAMFNMFLKHGGVQYKDHWFSVDPASRGIEDIVSDLGEESDDFFKWMTAKSAQALVQDGRTGLFGLDKDGNMIDDKQFIEDILDRVTPGREWEGYRNELRDINKAVLDFAEQSGMVNAESRKEWERFDYIPFYRVTEDAFTGDIDSMVPKAGLPDQLVHQLKGGSRNIGDPLTNLINGYSFMLNSSLKNVARKKSLLLALDTELVTKLPGKPEKLKNVVAIRHDGQAQYFAVHDQWLYDALVEMDQMYSGWFSHALRWMGLPKHWLTGGVTFAPAFRMANFMRDTLHSTFMSKSFVPVIDSFRGLYHSIANTDEFKEYAASGGAFSGAYASRDMYASSKKDVERIKGKLTGKRKLNKTRKYTVDMWSKLGEASENAARMGMFLKAKKKGASTFEAAYDSKDLLDFHKHGKFWVTRMMIQLVPFLNARLQGLSKLKRTGLSKKTWLQFALKGAMLYGASLALHLHNDDDERYQKLPDYDKRMYWHTWLGENHIKIPVPFEIGSIFGTLTPMALTEWWQGTRTSKELATFTKDVGKDMLAFNPLPQAFKPFVEWWANKDSFTGQQTVSPYMEKLSPRMQYDSKTTKLAREAGNILNLSPKKLDKFFKDFFAFHSFWVSTVGDAALTQLKDYPSDPAEVNTEKWLRVLGPGRFWDRGKIEKKYTKETQKFYEVLDEVETAYADYRMFRKTGQRQKARAFGKENKTKIKLSKRAQKVRQKISRINTKIRLVELSQKKTPEQKRLEINELIRSRQATIRKFLERLGG